MTFHRIDPSIKAEALELRRAGINLVDIGARLGISAQIVGRWALRAGIEKPPAVRKPHVRLRSDDHGYGLTCPGCGGNKSREAELCKPCRVAANTDSGSGPRFSADALLECLPVPVPAVSGTPRKVLGVLHVELDGSGERHV